MRKWMVEFLRNFENPGIKIARVNSILITKSIDLQLFAIYSEVYDDMYNYFKLYY